MAYRSLDPALIAGTIQKLEERIAARFPASGLRKVAGELLLAARAAEGRLERIRRPNWPLRGTLAALGVGFLAILILLLNQIRMRPEPPTVSDVIQDVESVLASLVFLGGGALFLVTLDTRIRRDRVLRAIHELRSLAHIVYMHQLMKDPSFFSGGGNPPEATGGAPSRPDLARYLDFCSEMLSLIAKVGALYVQEFGDSVALNAVDEVDTSRTASRGRSGRRSTCWSAGRDQGRNRGDPVDCGGQISDHPRRS